MEPYGEVAEQYVDFADSATDDSPCFEEWARAVPVDPEVLAWVASLPGIKRQPNLVFAAARWHGVPAPAPYAAFRDAVLGDDGSIRSTILSRSTQTNEVGRLATLAPVLARIAAEDGRPLALVEPGTSAGLCLYPDRWGYRWLADDGVRVLPGAVGPLECTVTGPAPLPREPIEVAWRAGIDVHPLDVGDDEAMAWLANLVWPEQDERRARLTAAVEVARADPPSIVAGDLLDALPALVAEASEHGQPVVFHSAVIAYLEPPDRLRFAALMADLVATRACRWISNEGPRVLPRVTGTGPALPAGASLFVLGLDGRAVAWTHGHGRSMTWHPGA